MAVSRSPSRTAGSHPKRLDIQVMRAAAVLLVVAYHLPGGWHLGGGFVGVDIFFAISGYVITESILRSTSGELQRVRFFFDFMRRRCRRLVPALSLAVAVAGVLILFVGPPDQARDGIHSALASLFFVSNYWFLKHFDSYWNPLLAHNPLLHMWSLAVEFQVYLAFPVIFIIVVRLLRDRERSLQVRWLAFAVAACGAVSLALFVYLLAFRTAPILHKAPSSLAFYTPMPRFWEFAAGAIVALAAARGAGLARNPSRLIKVAALAVATGSVIALGSADSVGLWVIPAIAAAAVLLAIPSDVEAAPRAIGFAGAVLVWVGDRSYSIYLWHWPFLALLVWRGATRPLPIALALLATLVVSDLSFRFVEQARWPQRTGFAGISRVSRPLWGFALALVILVGGAVAIRYDVIIHTNSATSVATPFPPSQVDPTAATLPMYDCGEMGTETHCDNAGPNAAELVVIGDSLGFRQLPAAQYVAKQHHLNTSMFWAPGCGIEFGNCPPVVRQYLSTHKIAGVIIAQNYARESVYANGAEADSGLKPACDPSRPLEQCPAHLKAVATFAKQATEGLQELTSITPHVLVALPFPQQALTFPNCLTSGTGAGPAQTTSEFACGWTSVAWQRARQGLFVDAIRKVAAQFPTVEVWDPVEIYCYQDRCPAAINGGEVIMNDAIHMTMEASRYSIPTYEGFVAKAVD